MLELPKNHRDEWKNKKVITDFLIEIDGLNYGCEEPLFDEKCCECFEFVTRLLDTFIYRGDYAIHNVTLNRVNGYMLFCYELINEEGSGIPPVMLTNKISEIDDKEKKIVLNGIHYDSYEEVLCKMENMIDDLI